MKKTLVILGIIAALACITRLCAEEVQAEESFYRPFEFQVDAFGELHTQDFDSERSAAGFGVNLFFTENFGIGASTSFRDLRGSAFDNVSLRGIWRAPFGRNAVYLFGGVTRQLQGGEWDLFLGPGLETRFTPNFGIFAETGINKQLTGSREATAIGRLGIRVSF